MSTDNHCCLSHTHMDMHTHTHTRRRDCQGWMWSGWSKCVCRWSKSSAKCPPTNTAVSHAHICIYINMHIHAEGIVSVGRGVVGGTASVHRHTLLFLSHTCIYINMHIHAGGIVSVRRGVVGGTAGAESVHRQPLLWLHGWQRLFVSGCYCLKAATCCNTL